MADGVTGGGGDGETENNYETKENLSNFLIETETGQGLQKDGDVQKNKEREERFRLARERQKEEQRRKMEELRDAMIRAEEFRKKQEEERRRKIEEMRKREEEHRAIVEERRKRLIDEENERKQALLRRTAEREAKLEQTKSKKMCNTVALRGAASAQNISVHLSKPGPGMHITSSIRDIHNSSMLRQNRHGDPVVVTSAAPTAVARLKRISASTGHLLKNAKTVNEDANFLKGLTSDDSKLEVDNVLHPLGCGKSYQSEGTLSSTGRSPSHHRPHSMAGRLPNYTSGTISSQLRVGRSREKNGVTGCAVVCSRFRSVSPTKNGRACSTGSSRRSRADIQKVVDQLATPSKPPIEAVAVRHVQSDRSAPIANPPRRARSVSSRPSKLSASPVSAPVVTATLPRGGKPSPSKPVTQTSARSSKLTSPLSAAISSSKGEMPSPPKTITPRSLPKEPKALKEVTANKSLTSNKVKAVHNQADQDQTTDMDKQAPEISSQNTESKEAKLIEQTDVVAAPNENPASPEKTDVMKKSVTEEDEYKLKLAEKRRLAREKAEREAEEERQRIERERREEEERILREEEEERRREEEELRLATEAARLEAERFQKAVEEEERRRHEEEERLEIERKEKLEAEQKAQEEAERKEKERAEKVKREEVERLERKKRLEMIMKRVKTEETSPAKPEAPNIPLVKPLSESDTVEDLVDVEKVEAESATPSVVSQPSTAAPDASTPSEAPANSVSSPPASAVSADPVDKGASQFRSPLLRQMLGNKMKAKQDVSSEASPVETVTEDAGSKESVSVFEVEAERLQASTSDVKPAETASDSRLDILAVEEKVMPTENITEGLIDVESLKESSDIETTMENHLGKEDHVNGDDMISIADILVSTDNEQLGNGNGAETHDEAKIIADVELEEENSEIIVETTVNQSIHPSEDIKDIACTPDTETETTEQQNTDVEEIAEPHEASGFLLSPEEMVGGGMLPSGIGASNGDDHSVICGSGMLIDLSPPEVSSGSSSLVVDSLINLETGASSPLRQLHESSIVKEPLLDLRADSGIDQLINLSALSSSSSDAVALERQTWSQSGFPFSAELLGQTTPSPVGIPPVVFEDNSSIQLKPINDILL